MPRKAQISSSPVKYRQKSLLELFYSSPTLTRSSDAKPKKGKGKRPQESETDSDVKIVKVRRRPATRIRHTSDDFNEDDDSSDVKGIKFEDRTSPLQDESEEDSDIPAAEPSLHIPCVKRRRLVRSDAEDPADDKRDELDSKGTGARRSTAKNKIKRVVDSDSESDIPGPRKGRLMKGIRPPSDVEDDVMDGIDEESACLGIPLEEY